MIHTVMERLTMATILVIGFAISGCEEARQERVLDIKAPGVNVEVDRDRADGSLEVNTGKNADRAVDIDVNRGPGRAVDVDVN